MKRIVHILEGRHALCRTMSAHLPWPKGHVWTTLYDYKLIKEAELCVRCLKVARMKKLN